MTFCRPSGSSSFPIRSRWKNVNAAELRRAIYGHGIVYNDAHALGDEAVTQLVEYTFAFTVTLSPT